MLPDLPVQTKLSGLEAFTITTNTNFVNVENVQMLLDLPSFKINSNNDYEEVLNIARSQVENGAQIIDVNMDEGMLNSEKAMDRFLKLIASEPDISRVPIMLDSSK